MIYRSPEEEESQKKLWDAVPKQLNINLSEFGFTATDVNVWRKEMAGEAIDYHRVQWNEHQILDDLVNLQKEVWGMDDRSAVPTNILAIAADTGGDILVAHDTDGALIGFTLSFGMADGRMILHMVGVAPKKRYQKDIGWNLMLTQGFLAQQKGISHVVWTYDPNRGGNARLYLEKLGALPYKFTVNKYGNNKNKLYGEERPTDRFTMDWDLSSISTVDRLRQIQRGSYAPLTLDDVKGIDVVTPESVDHYQNLPQFFLVEIPGEVDYLKENEATAWTLRFRQTMLRLVQEDGTFDKMAGVSPVGFATGQAEGQRRSYYLFRNVG